VGDPNELLERMLAAFNAGDVEEAIAVTDPEVEFVAIAEGVSGALPNGHEGLREWFRATGDAWKQLDATTSEEGQLGNWFVVSGSTRAIARGTDQELEWPWTAIAKVEGELIVKFGIYLSRDEALREIESDRP
jgi:ketosteroid isomerase-like protein